MENILKKIESQINLTTLKLQVPGLKKYNLQILYSHKFYVYTSSTCVKISLFPLFVCGFLKL